MRAALLALLALATVAAGCRTELRPTVKVAPPKVVREVTGECGVNQYHSATDVPAGAVSLGWVVVTHEGSTEETFEKLRLAVCAKGGNAFTQAHWTRAAGASVASRPIELEANVWVEAR